MKKTQCQSWSTMKQMKIVCLKITFRKLSTNMNSFCFLIISRMTRNALKCNPYYWHWKSSTGIAKKPPLLALLQRFKTIKHRKIEKTKAQNLRNLFMKIEGEAWWRSFISIADSIYLWIDSLTTCRKEWTKSTWESFSNSAKISKSPSKNLSSLKFTRNSLLLISHWNLSNFIMGSRDWDKKSICIR